jgi:hypothetical protein
MELTKEILLQRRASLEADIIALNGAIQQVDWSLDILEQGEDNPPAP